MSLTLPPLPYALDALEPIFRGALWRPITGITMPRMWRRRGRSFAARPLNPPPSRISFAPVLSRRPTLFSMRLPKHGTTHSIGAACAQAEEARHAGQSRS